MVDFTKKIKNSDKFRGPALEYIRSGVYCSYPRGTTEYIKFWEEEQERCINGYTAPDGDRITGYYYFYLNYCPILRIVNRLTIDKDGKQHNKRGSELTFPDFYDYDYYYFNSVQLAEDEGKHLCVIKSRRKGYEQPYSEEVLTPTGFVTMGSLKVGDMVMNPGGDSCAIIEINEQGERDVYEVELQDGRKIKCGENHLWSTINATRGKLHIKTTKEYSKLKLKQGSKGKEFYPYKLPSVNPLHFDDRITKVNPYVMGTLLGDGYICGSQIRFASNDSFIVEELTKLLPDYIVKSTSAQYQYVIISKTKGIHQLGRDLKEYGVRVKADYKFIPEDYKYASIEDRFELIRGLMDTDGSCTKGACTFVSISERLIDDVIWVLRSLGIRCKKSNEIQGKENVDFGNGHFSNTQSHWEIVITTEEPIFKLPRKLEKLRHDRTYNYNGIGLKSITKLDYKEKQRCLVVDHDNSLYLTKDFVPTHNSYKGGAMACRNYYLIPNSKTYVYASNKQYLTEDGILTKAWEYMDFVDKNTAWGKKRTVSTTMRRRAAYVITDEFGNKIECGYKSEIIGVSLKDNPDALRGKRAKLILFEEGGTFSELGAAWQIARPSVEQDGLTFGLMIVWGTGGDEGSAFATLKDMFYHPDGYNCLGFPNIWDDDYSDNKCGFFIPQYTNLDNRDESGNRIYMDNDGNTIHKPSLQFILEERRKVTETATSTTAIDRYVAERPVTPKEAMLEFNGNIFPKKEMQMQLSYIRTNKKLHNQKHIGDLVWEQGIPKWVPKKTGDITQYPLPKDADPTGSIVIWEHPMKDPPLGLYIAGCLTPGEKVITEDGLKNVEDVTLDDRLINKDGKFVIINTLLRFDKVDEPIYKIEMSNVNRSTTYTQEHPLYVANNIDEEFNFIKASEVKVGMWNKYPNIYNKELGIPFSLWDKYETGRTNHFNPMNEEDFWWFVGHWLGDGFNHQQGNNYTIYNSFGLEETEYVNKYKFIVNKLFNRKPNLKLQNGSNTHKFECKQLYLFLEENFGRYADGKYISEWVKYLPVNLKKHLMLGYLDADGSVYLDKTTIRCSFKSINKKLLDDTQDILFSLGIVNSFNFSDPAGTYKINGKTGNTKQSYAVRVCQSDLNKFGKLFDSDHNSRKLRLAKTIAFKQKSKLSNTCIMSDDNKYIYIKIKNIEESIYTGTIYNFDCETHSFISQYCTGHNCDPYDHDQSGTNSLGSTFIYKRIQSFEEYYEMPVAEYTGRPETAEAYYENVRKLLVYYNARLLYENERKGIFPYFTSKHCDYLLADQPDIIKDIVGKSGVNRQKGIHMSKPIKDWMEGLIKEWLCEEYAPGKKNLTKLLSEPLLEELISYNDTGNFDRCCLPGTKISTISGIKNIEDIKIGDKVLTHTGKFKDVFIVDKSIPTNPIVEIQTNGNTESLFVTNNHPLLVAREFRKKHKFRTNVINNISWVTPEKLINDNNKYDFLLTPKRKNLPNTELDPDLLYLIGWCLADGCISKHQLKITFDLYQEPIADKIASIIWKYTKNKPTINNGKECSNKYPTKTITITKTGGYVQITKTSKYLAALLSGYGIVSFNKLISPDLYNNKNLLPLVIGYLEGDGHQKKNANYDGSNRNVIECSTIYIELLKQIRQILIDNGIWSSFSFKTHNSSDKIQANINISDNNVNKLLDGYESIKFIKKDRMKIPRNIQIETEDGFWVPIKSINYIDKFVDYVYNLEVEDDHSYVGNSITMHNCIAFGLIMIYREQLHNLHVKEKKKVQKKLDLFGSPIFSDEWWSNTKDDSIDNDRTNTTTEEIYTF